MFNITEIFGEYSAIFELEFYQLVDYIFDTVKLIKNYIETYSTTNNFKSNSINSNTTSKFLFKFENLIVFSELQKFLLKLFFIVLLVNLVLIKIYWKKYGKIITDRFIRPSTLKEIEELKLSVARLKLPKEHSPRI